MLLSRHANHLFWLGRYIERCDHTNRFVYIQYDSILESPSDEHKRIVLNSLGNMFGLNQGFSDLNDPIILQNELMLHETNTNSIRFCISRARNNTMNVRNILSVEIWENVNRLHLFLDNAPEHIQMQGMNFELNQRVTEYCALIRNSINSTMLHDESWATIRLGIHLERSILISRILISQLSGIEKLNDEHEGDPLRFTLLITLLKSLLAKDMYYKTRSKLLSISGVVEFLITDPLFPRSINYNLDNARKIYNRIFAKENQDEICYEINRLVDHFKYIRSEDIGPRPMEFLKKYLNLIEQVTYNFERDHLMI